LHFIIKMKRSIIIKNNIQSMLLRFFCILFLLNHVIFCKGQSTINSKSEDNTSKVEYRDFVIVDGQIWALTTTGKLKVFDIYSGESVSDMPKIDSPIIAITKDWNSDIALALKEKIVVYHRTDKTISDLGNYSGKIQGMVFNALNICYLISHKGIEELSTHKLYFSDSSFNEQINYKSGWPRSSAYHLDNQGNIWIGFAYGEWGGDLFVFNTIARKFVIPDMGHFKLNLNPVKSIFSDDSSVYISVGLQHFDFSGGIVQFDHLTAKPLLSSDDSKGKNNDGEYIGPAAINPMDHYIYFYSQHGIFKGNPEKDLSTIDKWEKVVSPNLHWSYGQSDAVGYSMNVLKMEFADSKTLVFLTQLDGIGIFKNDVICLIK